ncbi:terminase gpA endonuclease subunit [Roseovarius sp. THAF9]|uniref:terminase gpA endonuclease subunit n=1 Tax=Roseovarius sp. THAF9 TaxID=2587847 RepID=UPI0034A5ACC2
MDANIGREQLSSACTPLRFWAIKGRSGPGIPFWPLHPPRTNKGGIPLLIVGVDAGKDAVYARLRLTEPGPRSDPLLRPPRRRLLSAADRRARLHPLSARAPHPLLTSQARRRTQRGPRQRRLRPGLPAWPDRHGAKVERGGGGDHHSGRQNGKTATIGNADLD